VTLASDTAAAHRRPVLAVLRTAPRPVWILATGTFVNRSGSFFATFATLFLTHRGVPLTSLPLVLAGIGAASMAGSLAGGWLSERAGYRNVLMLSMFASAAFLLLLAAAPNLPLVVTAACLAAFSMQSYIPAASELLIEHSRPEDRITFFAFFRIALNVGAAVGPLIAGFVATRSYTLLFSLDSLTSALCGLLILAGIKPRRGRAVLSDGDAEPHIGQVPAVGDDGPRVVRPAATTGHPPRTGAPARALCFVLFAVAMVYVQYQSTVPLELLRRGYSPMFYGVLLTLNGALVIVAELPISSVTRRLPWHAALTTGVLTMTLGVAAAGLARPASMLIIAFTIFTTGEMIFAPVANAAVAELSPPGRTARYQGLLATAQTLGFTLGPVAGTVLLGHASTGLWVAVLALGGGCSAAIYVIWRRSS
jgi:MFS family permease